MVVNSTTQMTFEGPCPYVPLSQYDWALKIPYTPPPGCPETPWNPFVIALDASFQACTFWMGLELNVQLFLQFRNRTGKYFWWIDHDLPIGNIWLIDIAGPSLLLCGVQSSSPWLHSFNTTHRITIFSQHAFSTSGGWLWLRDFHLFCTPGCICFSLASCC